jgi:hypothetical protein
MEPYSDETAMKRCEGELPRNPISGSSLDPKPYNFLPVVRLQQNTLLNSVSHPFGWANDCLMTHMDVQRSA